MAKCLIIVEETVGVSTLIVFLSMFPIAQLGMQVASALKYRHLADLGDGQSISLGRLAASSEVNTKS